MQDEENEYHESLNQLKRQHEAAYAKLEQDQMKEIGDKEEIQRVLRAETSKIETDNKKFRDDKETNEWEKIDTIKEKNKEELMKVTKQGLNAKADLTITNNKFREAKIKKETVERNLQDLTSQLQAELTATNSLKNDIESQKNELEERDKTIKDKDARIYQLMKKAQELEKFKFVLDYKIKELKRDIGPREVEIQKLKE